MLNNVKTSQTNKYSRQTKDYDLHGIVGIRLLNASPADAAMVTRDLGPIEKPLEREPDIIIRFVNRLPISTPVRYLGVDDAGFTEDAFLVLRSKHKALVRVQIPFDRIGRQCEIVCEAGLPAVPLLIPILNLTALAKGILPLHASAFTYRGTGVLATGWAKGGKTETLLAFAARGAEYVGDEWVYLSQDGKYMYGIPEPIRIWDWHLQEMPELWGLIKRGERARLCLLRLLVQSLDPPGSNGGRRISRLARLNRRVAHRLKGQLNVRIPPHKLFNGGVGSLVGNPDKIFFINSYEAPDIEVKPIDSQEIARRMVFSMQVERMELLSYYLKFRFAFPQAKNAIIEQAEDLQYKLLTQILVQKDTYAVYHPYPVSIPLLFDAISPFCE